MENESVQELPPYKIAFIIENEVVQIIHASERFAAILTSDPIIKDVTGMLIDDGGNVEHGSTYDPTTDTFTKNI